MDLSRAFDLNRAISHGYQGLQRAAGPMFLGAFLVWATQNSSSSFNLGDAGDLGKLFEGDEPGSFDWTGDPEVSRRLTELLNGDELGMVIMGVLGTLICLSMVALFFVCLNCWFKVGWLRTHKQLIVTGSTDYGPLFSGGDRFFDMLIWRMLRGVIVLGTSTVAASPALAMVALGVKLEQPVLFALAAIVGVVLTTPALLYVGLGLLLGDHALVLEGLSPMEALERSWSLAEGNRVTLLVFALVMGVLNTVGAAMGVFIFCIGVLITGPLAVAITELGFTESFLIAVEGEEEARAWTLVFEAGGL